MPYAKDYGQPQRKTSSQGMGTMSLTTLAVNIKRQSTNVDPQGHITWFQSLVVTSGTLLKHLGPLFPHLSIGDDSNTCFMRSSGRLKELTSLNYLA